jgi:hypothetical protein
MYRNSVKSNKKRSVLNDLPHIPSTSPIFKPNNQKTYVIGKPRNRQQLVTNKKANYNIIKSSKSFDTLNSNSSSGTSEEHIYELPDSDFSNNDHHSKDTNNYSITQNRLVNKNMKAFTRSCHDLKNPSYRYQHIKTIKNQPKCLRHNNGR